MKVIRSSGGAGRFSAGDELNDFVSDQPGALQGPEMAKMAMNSQLTAR
jgi:hypothetical protein